MRSYLVLISAKVGVKSDHPEPGSQEAGQEKPPSGARGKPEGKANATPGDEITPTSHPT